ncbi:hypothetical protein PIB30_013426 [Stylosanthes scabra]|uniref:Serpin domain-containing protein n=1 Tax=Stylosanthes scabra TaxID=79078 RepID=A0ABU6X3S2_9FABA|nr:hypothetical protein [Stylosanthes scabra]
MDDLSESINNQTQVAFTIANHLLLSKNSCANNIVFSPLLLHLLLSITAAGSKGPTRDQLLSFLRSNSIHHLNSLASRSSHVLSDATPAGGPRMSFASGAWVDESLSLKPSFKQLVNHHYKAVLASVDFQTKADEARKEVNSWAEKETNGLINELLPAGSVDPLTTRLIFANAIYFKGAWIEKFDAQMTEDDDFHLVNGSSVKVPFMTSNKKQFIGAFDGFKVLGLPYKQGKDKRQFSMYLFLPDAIDGLPSLIEKLNSESGFLEDKLPYQKVEVGDFRIPKFKISFGFETSNALKELGLVLPFKKGDLTEMVDHPCVSKKLFVSSIYHKSFIEVNEEGTEAASASAMCCGSSYPRFRTWIDFVADHPFLFVVREDVSGAVLFIGQVLNPLDNSC